MEHTDLCILFSEQYLHIEQTEVGLFTKRNVENFYNNFNELEQSIKEKKELQLTTSI